MQAARAQTKLISDCVVLETFFPAAPLKFLFRKLHLAFNKIFIVLLSTFERSFVQVVKVEPLVVIQNFFANSVSFLCVLFKVATVSDREEDLLQGSDRDAVAGHSKRANLLIKLVKEIFELRGVLNWDLEGDLARNLRQQMHFFTQVRLQVRFDALIRELVCFLKREIVAHSVALFQEKRGAKADELSLGHDADSVAKHVRLVHVMCRQNYNSIVAISSQHVPQGAASLQVHSTCWLIKHDKF
mmetsp:Transcript_30511/g.37570  ORF Transcript_30511/g.37570 Transcript_30511/m.37570 type:complete len:243 (-) Transcript_30511:2382-3110(-)